MAKNPSIRRRAVLGIAAAPPLLFALVVVLPRVVSPAFAFAPPPPAVVGGGVSRRFGHPPPRLGYGPRVDDGGDQDPPSSAAPPACATGHDLLRDRGATTSRGDDDDDDDPTTDDAGCTVEDEDCLAFSSLGNDRSSSSSSSSSYDDDDVCDPVDVDCRSFLPPSSDDGDGASWSTTATATTASRLLAAELASRSAIVDAERIDRNWRTAHCPASFAPVPSSASSSGGGRVRGTSLDVYPIAACGTSTGGVCVIDLESNRVLGAVENAHRPGRGVPPAGGGGGMGASCEPRAVEHLYGGLDGGGTVSVAIRGDVVASSGREGGARLWRVVPRRRPRRGGGGGGATTGGGGAPSGELVPLCSLPGLGGTIVTRLAFDPSSAGGLLWASCYDGTVRAWDVSRYCRGDPAASSAPPAEDDDDGIRTSRPPPPPSVSEPLFTSDFTGEPSSSLAPTSKTRGVRVHYCFDPWAPPLFLRHTDVSHHLCALSLSLSRTLSLSLSHLGPKKCNRRLRTGHTPVRRAETGRVRDRRRRRGTVRHDRRPVLCGDHAVRRSGGIGQERALSPS